MNLTRDPVGSCYIKRSMSHHFERLGMPDWDPQLRSAHMIETEIVMDHAGKS